MSAVPFETRKRMRRAFRVCKDKGNWSMRVGVISVNGLSLISGPYFLGPTDHPNDASEFRKRRTLFHYIVKVTPK